MVREIYEFYTQKLNKAKIDFEKDFYNLINNAFCGKTMEIIGYRIKVEYIKKDDNEKIVEQQSKLTFGGIHKFFTKI